MSEEFMHILPVHRYQAKELQPAVPATPLADKAPDMVHLEHAREVDAFFEQDKEFASVAQFLALYGGGMLIADQAGDHLQPPEEAEDAKQDEDNPPAE